jgi:hypothetical protein
VTEGVSLLQLVTNDVGQFAGYIAPAHPPIALSARVQGDVDVRLEVSDATAVSVLAGHPLLDASALDVARQCRFLAGTTPSPTVTATSQYAIRCD